MIFFGYYLKRKGFINDNFVLISQRFVFLFALPALIFKDIAKTDFLSVFDLKLLTFAVVGTLVIYLLLSLATPYFVKNRQSQGAFIQGVYRSNFAIIGLPLILNLFGQTGLAKGAIILSFVMPLYNVLAVIILTVTAPEAVSNSLKGIAINIIKNPLIIGAVLALPFSYFQIGIPVVIIRSIDYLSDISIPLALLGIGGSISFRNIRGKLAMSLSATVLKIAALPFICTAAALFTGLRGDDIGIIFVLFASPTAISSFIMAKAMKSDADLSAHIVLLTTLGSVFTIFLGVFVMKALEVI